MDAFERWLTIEKQKATENIKLPGGTVDFRVHWLSKACRYNECLIQYRKFLKGEKL